MCKKHVNLLMIENYEERHDTTIRSASRLLSKLNSKNKQTYHYCMNSLHDFYTESTRDKHYEYCSSNGHVKVNIPTGKRKMVKISRWRISV